jgi:hypothetical protein
MDARVDVFPLHFELGCFDFEKTDFFHELACRFPWSLGDRFVIFPETFIDSRE